MEFNGVIQKNSLSGNGRDLRFATFAYFIYLAKIIYDLRTDEKKFQIHVASSGIGTFAIQIAKHQGVRVFVTAGSEEKLTFCKNLGADVCINYKTEDFVARVKEETGGKGVDVILDNVGGSYFQRNLDSLNVGGRLFIIGFMGGVVTEVNLAGLLARRLTVQAARSRNRSPENKAVIVSEVEKNVWPAITAGKVKPIVYKSFPLAEAAEAHQLMESSKHIGKILLVPSALLD
ncbi:quinone oxidoreductase PIG3-like [Telopea speciosissima]|uniref:quinone oxidoreductase PIG3-like n=1 Tax=Telopea speciosissima TaxID=54955 RepID=UPI001CC487FD|nr:quinone oxidoreductase PIG3-like [Telopea speciosissima]